MQRIATFLACGFYQIGVALLATLLAANSVQAQTPTPTAEQMEIFRNLPPDQQQAILESLGSSGSGSASRDGGVRRDRDLSSPKTVRPDGTTNGRDGAEGREEGEDVTEGYDYLSDYYSGRMEPREPRIRANDSVLLDVRLKQVDPAVDRARSPQEKRRIEEMLERTLRSNPYKLDTNGVLRIPGIEPIPLAGLKEDQATERLKRDPAMRDFEIELTLLPLEKLDAEALKPFGYDLFAGTPSTFAPVTDVPVPSEYVVGPGDRFEVQLIGTTKGRYSLVVNRDGRVMFPELGPIAVSGLQFDEAKDQIQARVNDQMIGTQAIISMGELRSIRVFVLGEAQRPGSYTVSGLATITNALFASGGIKKIGSLRDIQVKRNDKIIKRLDLYELLMNGRTSSDVRLLPGDVIFIPPVGRTVAVTGEIRRPAIYELKGESSVAELVHLGGGLTPEADPRLANIERLDERRDRVVISLDLGTGQARSTPLRSGDLLRIPRARPTFANAIQLKGHVHRPSSYQYRSGMRVTDVLPSIEELKPNADLHYVLIRRERPGTRQVQALSVDLERAWSMPATDADPLLEPRDQLLVFDLETGRKQYLDPIIEDLKLQAVSSQPSHIVRVTGRVRAEGEYPLEVGMTLSDLIRAGGGLAEQAYGGEAELARYEVRNGQTRQTTVLKVDLAGVLAGDPAADLVLGPFDTLVVKEISEWSEQEVVRLEGEVRFPGDYPIARGETLRALIARAGGLTPWAFTQGSLFTRDTLKERERQQIKLLADRMQQDLGSLALQSSQTGGPMGSQAAETLAIGRSLLDELKAAEPVGRLVIDLDRVLAAEAGSNSDLMLKSGDRLRVPRRAQEVTVIGEVQNSTSHLYDPAYARDDYLRMSGGTTKKADDKRIYVVRANGSVEAGTGSRWFQSAGGDIRPGDTIVVPLDAERMRPLPLWTSVSTIIYNLAVAVAAVGSFD
jgi:polysaccharide export outer membrane protein